jgi:hypothetical protein
MAAYTSSTGRKVTTPLVFDGGVNQETLAANMTLTRASATYQSLDPGGSARDVTLPAEEPNAGLVFSFYNAADAAENLVIKDDAAATIVTIAQGGTAVVACADTDDDGLGNAWVRVG